MDPRVLDPVEIGKGGVRPHSAPRLPLMDHERASAGQARLPTFAEVEF